MRYRFFCLLLLGAILSFPVRSTAQSPDFNRSGWLRVSEQNLAVNAADRQIIPQQYATYHLDIDLLRITLANAPTEAEMLAGDVAPVVLEIPRPDGSFATYQVWDFGIFHPELQAKFPNIRSYCGVDVDQPGTSIFLDVSPAGFHAMTLHGSGGPVFIDPYSRADDDHYLVYFKKDFVRAEADRMLCLVEDDDLDDPKLTAATPDLPAANCGVRREYRLALAATGEYTGVFGGTVAAGLAAMNTSMTRVNGVFVTEASIKMILIGNNDLIVYTNGSGDPYTNGSGGTMLGENQANLDQVIGSANYDIGHVFSTGGGGVATLRSPCNNAIKARGVTGRGNPVGDPFDIDYVAHEMGHQYGGNHTFSSVVGSCSGNGSSGSAFEPGSGTTIMAYAGICGAANVQSNSDPYFHARSLLEFSNFVTGVSAGPHTCDNEISVGNSAPAVPAFSDVTFPHSTPFVLTGSATDGQALTYCWEQYNNALVSPPAGANTSGPLFRSLSPVGVNYRYFPSFDNVFGGTTDAWEVLPTVARTLTFRFTARDNLTTGGCSNEQSIAVTIGSNGPFNLTAPNGGQSLFGNNLYTVTWNVAGTSAATPNVDILYSTTPSDPTSYTPLLSNTPNDGSQVVVFPNITSSTLRVMVRSASTNGIFFYDLSDANNSIVFSLPVELTAFAVEKAERQALLRWSTASEVNNRGFAIQRSVNDTRSFVDIGWVNAVTTPQASNNYQFADPQVRPGNTYYYRLAQTDLDGAVQYSDVQSVTWDGTASALLLSPNPVRDYVQLTAPGAPLEDEFEVTVFDSKGRLVAQQRMSLNNALPTREWPAGVYYVRAVAAERVWTGVVVK